MFGIPLVSWAIIACIAALALSMVPASVWPKLPEIKPLPDAKPVDTSNKYLAVQKMLLDARTACGECPEAITAIDAAIRATVAMVCKSDSIFVRAAVPSAWTVASPKITRVDADQPPQQEAAK